MTCDVCGRPSIEVASSSIGPISWAFCEECLRNGAEPECLMWFLRDYIVEVHPEVMNQLTFVDGKYITYQEWLALEKPPLPEPLDEPMLEGEPEDFSWSDTDSTS